MDQVKIGKFIAERRKMVNLTQMQLAEKLNITDRAVSKWETGRAMPDSSIMLELCEILGISVNELLSGEVISMENYDKKLEENLVETVSQKQTADKHLLRMELVVVFVWIALMLVLCVFAAYVEMQDWLRITLIIVGLLPMLILMPFLIKVEQVVGYYECRECGHRYVPLYKSVLMSMHMGRTRYMKCPNCGKKSWQRKVTSKE